MTLPMLEDIRTACRAVAADARYVHIVEDRLAAYAAELWNHSVAPPMVEPAHHYVADPESTLAFFLTLDAINFGSGYFPYLRKRSGLSGYFTIATSLKDQFDAYGPFTAAHLMALDAKDCVTIFGQQGTSATVAELMALFSTALNQFGQFVHDEYDGEFTRLVDAANHSAEALVGLLSRIPFYRDIRDLDGMAVPFFKRAQLSAADLALALNGHARGRFDDLDRLTIFADNLVPHVLRLDGILAYGDDLVARIEREELIPVGSRQEVEIRAVALHAVELMVTDLRRCGAHANAMQLDYLLWNRGQSPRHKARRRHRTRTVSY